MPPTPPAISRLSRPAFTAFFMLLAALCLLLLFVGGPGYHSSRSFKNLWNLGHVPAFALWTWMPLTHWKRPASWPAAVQFLMLAGFIVTGAFLTEGAQMLLTKSRNMSLEDAMNDAAGGLLVFAAWHWRLPRRSLIFPLIALAGGGFLLMRAILPAGEAILDEYRARRSFPVLADFEHVGELSRFSNDSNLAISKGEARHGNGALRISLSTAQYSGASLFYFNGDWRGYDNLVMEVRNDSETPLDIICRIHDHHHNQATKDRFNRNFVLTPGWNTISIPLADVKMAPAGREMDMAGIYGVSLFTVGLLEPRAILLDYMRLTHN